MDLLPREAHDPRDDADPEVPMDWRPVCPTCGRFIAAAAVVPVLDVLTYEAEGLDTIRDMAECGRCGRIEVELRPTRWARLSELDPA